MVDGGRRAAVSSNCLVEFRIVVGGQWWLMANSGVYIQRSTAPAGTTKAEVGVNAWVQRRRLAVVGEGNKGGGGGEGSLSFLWKQNSGVLWLVGDGWGRQGGKPFYSSTKVHTPEN